MTGLLMKFCPYEDTEPTKSLTFLSPPTPTNLGIFMLMVSVIEGVFMNPPLITKI